MSQVNKYNLFRWDDDGSPVATCSSSEYCVPVIPGDTVGVYINFDNPISDDITDWELGIWVPSSIVVRNIATINEVDLDGTTKDLYFEYVVGNLPRFFRFVMYDTDDSDAIKYWSNWVKWKSEAGYSKAIKYKNSFNQVNFSYEQATTFYNQARIDCELGETRPRTDTVGYSTSLGLPVTSKNIFSKQVQLVPFMLDAEAHLALAVAVKTDEFYLDGTRYYTRSEDQYDSGAVDQYLKRWNGRCTLYEYDYTVVASNT